MEVVMPVSASDFNFDSTASSQYMSAPSSPKRFGAGFDAGFGADYGYFSAPSSPSRAASIYNDLARFDWDKNISPPKSAETGNKEDEENDDDDDDFDFQFGFSSQISSLSTAEELFEKGKIRPLKPQIPAGGLLSPKRAFGSPGKGFVPAEEPRRGTERGRERGPNRSPSTNRRSARSLSPLRAPEHRWEEPIQTETPDSQADPATSKGSTSSSKRWSLKDLLLFRSASEGRATTGKDPLRKYSGLWKTRPEETKNPSCRPGETPASGKKGRNSGLSAHYTANRAVSEEMRRKTYLPYKPGLFGFNLGRRL